MINNTNSETNKSKKFISIVLGVYVIAIGFIFPLVVKNKYFDILVFKYYFYCFCTITMFVLLIGHYLTRGIKNTISAIKLFNIKSLLVKCYILDIFILLYWFNALISTFTSDYLYESFWGNEGRFTGFFLITLYVISYFCISRFLNYKNLYVNLILIAGIFVCIFGITDYFNLDIFNFKKLMLPEQRPIFTSTIGNINTYTAYVGIIIALATVLFSTEKNVYKMCFYYICVVIGFFAIIMGVSDNAYLSLSVLFGLLPIYLFKNNYSAKKYFTVIATFFTVAQCIDWINFNLKEQVLGIDSAFNVVISYDNLHYIVILLWFIVLLWNLYDMKKRENVVSYGNKLLYAWLLLIAVICLYILFVLYDCNIAGNAYKYSAVSNYLRFNDDWGTHRGYIWRNAIECFNKLSVWKKIVGYGPETFGILLLKVTKNNPYNELFDSAHNEYLHTLLTVGILGLSTYVFSLFAFIKNCFSYRNNVYITAIAFGVICYSAQAFVNLNLPIVTPFLWLLMGIGTAISTKENKETF